MVLALRFSDVKTPVASTNGTHPAAAAIALSSREINVLNLVARGLSNKQIANKLGISDKTVRNHLSRIFRKLEAGNRTQAVMNAMRVGLLTI
jgi:two-component system, NarL family, response regulator LiaR